MEIEIYLQSFFILAFAHFLALISPGVDFFIIINSTIKNGKRAGIIVAFGIAIANLVYILLALFGIMFIKDNLFIFNFLKLSGCVYLFYISYYLFKSKRKNLFENVSKNKKVDNHLSSFFKGFLSAILNPKNFIFYFSMFSITFQNNTPFFIQTIYGLWMFFAVLIWDVFIVYILNLKKIKQLFNRYIYLIEKISAVFLTFVALIIIYKI